VPVNEAHRRYQDVLFTRADKRYPSHRILDRIEASITDRETAERYVELLMAEAERQRYPSLLMLDRARRVVARLAIADEIERKQREEEQELEEG
jgi:hypothetical protein